MKRRLSVWIAFTALALRLAAPFAASAAPAPGLGDICSAAGKASAGGETPAGSPLRSHLLSHCADCPCGTSALALPAAFVLPLPAPAHAPVAGPAAPTARPAAAALFPPPRGPPSIAPFV